MSTRTLRIEHIVPSLIVGGMEMVVTALARAQRARGHEVGVTCLEHEGALGDTLRDADVAVHVVRTPGLKTLVHAPELARHFAARRADVVHSHSGVWEKSARAARVAGVRRVVHTVHGLHDREPWWGAALKQWGMFNTDWVVAVSEPLRDYLVGSVRLPRRRVRVLMNGVSTDRFQRGPRDGALRARLGIPADAPLIGTVARLVPVKNHAMLVRAYADLLATRPDAHLVIVGDGPMREDLVTQIASLGLEGRAHLPGTMSDLPPVYRELDAFVLSSFAEGTSISLLEAMATEVASVATAVGGNVALLDNGACGPLIASDDAPALTRELARLLADADERRRLGALARARVFAEYSEAAMLDGYDALYDNRTHASVEPHAETVACAG